MCSITWWHFHWPWRTLTRFSRSRHFWSRISQKQRILGTKLLKYTNRNHTPSIEWYHSQWPWETFDPISRSRHFLKSNIIKTACLKDKVTIAQYGMVLCLVTLTDLQTHRAGLSASAELLVNSTTYNYRPPGALNENVQKTGGCRWKFCSRAEIFLPSLWRRLDCMRHRLVANMLTRQH